MAVLEEARNIDRGWRAALCSKYVLALALSAFSTYSCL